MERIQLPSGRTVEYLMEGPPGALPLVIHHGTPAAAVRLRSLFEAARQQGLRVILHSRPGYGGSSPHPGRRVADVAADVASILDEVGAPHFVTAGWSGGGPHALACAALLPGRCIGAAIMAGVAPGSAWSDDMTPEHQAEFEAAARGVPHLDRHLTERATQLATITGDDMAALLAANLSEADRRALTGELADHVAASFRSAVSAGIAGWREDDLAVLSDWGFRLDDIRIPVALWHGEQDRMVPESHAHWLAAHIPGAEAHMLPDDGHLSLLTDAEHIFKHLLAHAT